MLKYFNYEPTLGYCKCPSGLNVELEDPEDSLGWGLFQILTEGKIILLCLLSFFVLA